MIYEVGAIFLLVSVIPQMVKTYRNRGTLKDISFLWVTLGLVGSSLLSVWAYYNSAWLILSLQLTWVVFSVFTITQLMRRW